MTSTSYSMAKSNFARLYKEACEGEIIVIEQESGDKVAMIAAGELESLMESVHLLRSPNNARRFFLPWSGVNEVIGKLDREPWIPCELSRVLQSEQRGGGGDGR